MLKYMKVLLAIVLFVGPYVEGHLETSDLEENVYLKLEKLLVFKKKADKNSKSQKSQDRIHALAVRIGGTDALYGYDGGPGTSNWGGTCASGHIQSPINFSPAETVAVYRRVFRLNGAQQIPQSTNITNSGHSVKVKLRTQKPITVTGGVFGTKTYEFQQLHFHWGKNVNEGSEHTIKTKAFPLEAHLVFYKADSKDPTTEKDGIAVLGVQYDTSEEPEEENPEQYLIAQKSVKLNYPLKCRERILFKRRGEVRQNEGSPGEADGDKLLKSFRKDNQVLDPIIKSLEQIAFPGQYVVKANGVPLRDYLPEDLDSYFSYTGSLTTPPCTEGVTWIVFTQRQSVSERQVSQFREVKDDLGWKIAYNYRETQPLNGRQVHLVKSSPRVVE